MTNLAVVAMSSTNESAVLESGSNIALLCWDRNTTLTRKIKELTMDDDI